MKLIEICALLSFFLVTASVSLSWSNTTVKSKKMSIQADDGFTEEELNYIDDQPEACTGMSILPNGESMYEWEVAQRKSLKGKAARL